ncbi:hypothetical protein V5O48_017658 [Marasmius crinis-equi]|uniref:F-box domain-containing protein n=1 Tax=Marasmius crinis-equi TaxID=585013 RepID=A0ABR3ENC9_9AGAR
MVSTLPSSFSYILDTNHAPSLEERVEIESLLHGPEERLRVLEAEINKLQAEKEELRRYIDRHRALLSPFRRLPADLWGEIFVHALPLNEYNLPGRTLKDAPLLLTHICRTWRDIAMRTPRLWNSIHIYLPRKLPRMRRNQIPSLLQARKDGIKAWLDRSGSLPITFSIAVGPDSGNRTADIGALNADRKEIDTSLASVSALLARYSRRWKAMRLSHELNDISPVVWQPLAELKPDDMPLLQDIHVEGELFTHDFSRTPSAVPTPVAHLLQRLPRLRRLHITKEPSESVLDLQLDLTSLTDLHIMSFNDSDPPSLIARLTKSCPLLSSLSLVLVHHRRPPQHRSSPGGDATHQEWCCLRNLDVQLMETYYQDPESDLSDSLRETFRRLRTPALEHLTVSAIGHQASPHSTYDGSVMPFHEMIVQSNCPVTHLALDTFLFSNPPALSRTLEFMPSLKSMKLSNNAHRSGPGWFDMVDDGRDDFPSLATTLLSLSLPTSICSNVEKLDLRGCKIAHADAIIAFATAAPKLKDLSAEFGALRRQMVSEAMFSDRVRDALARLREVKQARVVWKWQKDSFDYSAIDRPYAGMTPVGSRFEPEYEFL